MKVGIYPNEETAESALVDQEQDVIVINNFDGCCHTVVLVPYGPYSDIFEDEFDTYVPRRLPTPHNCYERRKTLEEVKEEILRIIPEASFVDLRVSV